MNTSWKVDETYIKIKGEDRFLYRAVDTKCNTIRSAKVNLAGIEILHMIFKGQSGYYPLYNQNPINA